MNPEPHGRFLNVVDVEATCWEGNPPPGQVNEIIEIGLCVVDVVRRERVERDRIIVRPARSRVSAFCTELTGITQEEVDGGVSFAEACDRLAERHRAGSRRWTSWGDYDRKQFERQCGRGSPAPNPPIQYSDATAVRYPFGRSHVNAKQLFADAHGIRRLGMAGALKHAGLPLEGRHHNGADDAWNIGALVVTLIDRGAWPGATSPSRSTDA